MKRSIHRSACAALVLTALALTGCEWKKLNVLIPDFENSVVQGMQLWRAEDEASPIWSEAGQIVFGDRVSSGDWEGVEFAMLDSQHQPIEYTFAATLVRGGDGDSVTLHFVLSTWRELPGWIRASTFNAVGESDLSDEAVFL